MSATRIVRRREARGDPAALADLPPLLARIYAARGVAAPAEVVHALEGLHGPEALGGMAGAVELLRQALEEGRRLLVVGDFDADGATASALMVRALAALGAEVDFLVPNRFEYGYGLTPEIVAVAAQRRPDVIITVDNGVSSVAGVAAARARGMQVLVTDHHLPGPELPAADAMVNPNLRGDGFPSKHLAGVGVAFYVLMALRARLRAAGWFRRTARAEPNLGRLLDLVALGTVADVVPLDRNNRILVAQGLDRIRAGRGTPGVAALLAVAGRDPARAVAADLGFAAGPRLNAAGRLEDMSQGIACLLAEDPAAARAQAAVLDELNRARREIESDMQAQALAAIDALGLERRALPTGLCLYHEDWHQGVVGILASRVKERFHRPVIGFAPAGEGMLKGSARSVPGLHVRDALDSVAARNPGLITRFGGHAMAAGLSLPAAHFDAFSEAFDAEARRHLDADDLRGVVHSDGPLEPAELTLETAELLRAAGPWGQGFPEPVFDGVFRVGERRVVGGRHLKLTLRPRGGEPPVEAIAFGQEPDPCTDPGRDLHVAYRLDANEFRGLRSLQLVVEHLAPA